MTGEQLPQAAQEAIKAWRDLGDSDRQDFLTWMVSRAKQRNLQGRKVYGDTFQGDPLDHAIEEALDLLFYLWVERRRQAIERYAASGGVSRG